jgi:2,3,4,5-tetrahydropyridine-2-carboxylate N-succinyltransferase
MRSLEELKRQIERFSGDATPADPEAARDTVSDFLSALASGSVRAAEPGPEGWQAVEWVKKGVLLAFRVGRTTRYEGPGQEYFDRDTLPLKAWKGVPESVRVVPGGTSVRAGAYLASGVVIMPPAYINTGAYVGEGTMIDSNCLIGSCAQIGARVHISAGAQIGGVLEPIGLRPVVIEDEVVVGGNAGVFEGTLVCRRAVVAPGANLTASTPVFDLVRDEIRRATPENPLTIPEGAVVVPGSRQAGSEFAKAHGLQLYAPVIVKYRDAKTDAATALEEALR